MAKNVKIQGMLLSDFKPGVNFRYDFFQNGKGARYTVKSVKDGHVSATLDDQPHQVYGFGASKFGVCHIVEK